MWEETVWEGSVWEGKWCVGGKWCVEGIYPCPVSRSFVPPQCGLGSNFPVVSLFKPTVIGDQLVQTAITAVLIWHLLEVVKPFPLEDIYTSGNISDYLMVPTEES